MPIAAPARIGNLAAGWNHIQLQMLSLEGGRGLELARQLAMTTYRSEIDFDTRDDIGSYLEHQGVKLRLRFHPESYRALVAAMNAHDVGRGRGGIVDAFRRLSAAQVEVHAVGIEGDLLYGPRQVRALIEAARTAGVSTTYREIRSDKGHDAFLVEWNQLAAFLDEVLDPERRVAVSA
jgi:homoserine O-acetyltransferase